LGLPIDDWARGKAVQNANGKKPFKLLFKRVCSQPTAKGRQAGKPSAIVNRQ
jgi:hypothetical protein